MTTLTALQHAAYVADAREAHALYESMPTRELHDLQAVFTRDLAHAVRPETIAFGAGRLALIAAVLTARSTGNSPPSGGLAESHGDD